MIEATWGTSGKAINRCHGDKKRCIRVLYFSIYFFRLGLQVVDYNLLGSDLHLFFGSRAF